MSVTRLRRRSIISALLVVAISFAYPGHPFARTPDEKELLGRLETPGLLLGEFALASNPVVDGDTIKVLGLESSLRLLGIDTEETFKKSAERQAFQAGWSAYLRTMRGDSERPVKMATPLGENAKEWAEAFLRGANHVRLERDHPKEIRDYYNRYLAYVFVEKHGKWLNFNVECVRAGMSPYFTKYGYSRRFHDDFVSAQKAAQAAQRGIWDPKKLHYPDYDERLFWWNARADFHQRFEEEASGKDDYVVLTHWDALKRLEDRVGQSVVLLGGVGDIKLGDRGPTKVFLSRRMRSDFELVFFDKDVFLSSGISRHRGEFVRVRGTVTKYHPPNRTDDELQIIIKLPGQVAFASEQ